MKLHSSTEEQISTRKTNQTLFGKEPRQFPVGQHHIYSKEEEDHSQRLNN